MKNKMLASVEAKILFLGSLVGYNDALLLLPVFFFTFCLLQRQAELKSKWMLYIYVSAVLILLYACLSLFLPDFFLPIERDKELLPFKVVGYLALLFNVAVILFYFKDRPRRFEKVISIVLSFHLFLFYLQAISYYSFGFYIDYMEVISGSSQRAFYLGYLRPTGVFVEPSTYAYFTLALLVAKVFLRKRSYVFVGLTLISIALTFSTAAYVSILVFIPVYLFSVSSGKKSLIAIFSFACVLSPFLYASSSFQLSRYYENSGGIASSDSVQMRLKLVQHIFDREVLSPGFWLGSGVYSYEKDVYAAQSGSSRIAAVDDGTVVVSLFFRFGLLGILIFYMMLKNFRGWRARGLILSVFATKIIFLDLIFWLPFVAYAVSCQTKEKDI
ncbi:hypothetical protein BCL93_1197 [Onishia taeanensis]|uniref:O-antigen ligase-like membrane protein n=1 Tax=Onishia taeanensis TaxID=284577 RepID=A0A328XM75_9GAMM|nr:hypothetical protein [Halomonas taeanensis]RAR56805.1 hypothetical protein BCL93_1197 [Halomonas taeanensis]